MYYYKIGKMSLSSQLSDVLDYIKEKEFPDDIYLKCCNELQKIFNKKDDDKILKTVNYNTKILFKQGSMITILKRDIYGGTKNDNITYKINDDIKVLESAYFYNTMISYLTNYDVKIYYNDNMDLPVIVDDWYYYKTIYAEIEKKSCRCSWDHDYGHDEEHESVNDSYVLNHLLAIG